MSNIMDKLALYFIAFIITLTSSCDSCEETLDAEKYRSYVCYDYHLTCFDVSGKSNTIDYVYKFYDSEAISERVSFQKIDGESDDQFVYATAHAIAFGPLGRLVMQNPDNYIDVWNDWTIEKIELFYIDYSQEIKESETAKIPSAIAASTQSANVIAEIKEIVLSETSNEKFELPEGYINARQQSDSPYVFYIRVHFNESDNIIWDTKLYVYYSEELEDRIIVFDKGRKIEGFVSRYTEDISIDKSTALFSWLNEAIEQTPQPKKQ